MAFQLRLTRRHASRYGAIMERITGAVSLVLVLTLALPCVCAAMPMPSQEANACHEDMAGRAPGDGWTPLDLGACCCTNTSDEATFSSSAQFHPLLKAVAGAASPVTPRPDSLVGPARQSAFYLNDPPFSSIVVLRL